VQYPIESFTADERALLEAHVTNLDQPVFALTNLPETIKGALFARYSRYPGTLRRLLLDEFAADLPEASRGVEQGEGARASQLYERMILGYGDDSVAQLGGAHVACEWVSNVLTKVLQRPRLGAYLEQSTRYIAYDQPMEGAARGSSYRYYRDEKLGLQYTRVMDELFTIYSRTLPRVMAWAEEVYPRDPEEPEAAYRRAIRAKALDLTRGLLPASSLSHMGIFATGQTYEQLVLHLLAHPLPEAQRYGAMILETLQSIIPSFVARVPRPNRGGAWVSYLEARAAAGERWARRLDLDESEMTGPAVRLVGVEGDETDLLAALLFESATTSEARIRETVEGLDASDRAELLGDLVGERTNRRHRPGRGFESLRYRFEIVADYGAFRDLQRHRMLTVQWQTLGPDLGAEVPEQIELAGAGDDYRRALETSSAEYHRLVDGGLSEAAPYAICLGYRIRFILDLNAREAMQLIELRSGREGHPSYRAVAHEMHAQIAEVHPAVAAAMNHIDLETEPRLERILSEMRTQVRAAAGS
jgi:thymidylate synthase ThyX